MSRRISIADDFSRYPAGRFLSDGPFPGQLFRDKILYPALEDGSVELVIDGVSGLPSSFLEESLGGLVRKGMPVDLIKSRLKITAHTERMKSYIPQAWKYVEDAGRAPAFAS